MRSPLPATTAADVTIRLGGNPAPNAVSRPTLAFGHRHFLARPQPPAARTHIPDPAVDPAESSPQSASVPRPATRTLRQRNRRIPPASLRPDHRETWTPPSASPLSRPPRCSSPNGRTPRHVPRGDHPLTSGAPFRSIAPTATLPVGGRRPPPHFDPDHREAWTHPSASSRLARTPCVLLAATVRSQAPHHFRTLLVQPVGGHRQPTPSRSPRCVDTFRAPDPVPAHAPVPDWAVGPASCSRGRCHGPALCQRKPVCGLLALQHGASSAYLRVPDPQACHPHSGLGSPVHVP